MLVMDIEGRLDSWKKIAVYLQRDERTAQRWHAQRGLPVHHIPGSRQSSVFAYRAEIDAWLTSSADRNHAGRRDLSEPEITHAQNLTSRALALWECRSETNLIRIIDLCREAIVENPVDAEAFGVMASAYIWAVYIDVLPASHALQRASRAVTKALALDPRQPQALAAGAWVTLCADRNGKLAEAQFRECLTTQPEHAFALVGLSTSLTIRGKFDEARSLMKRAWQAEPLSVSMSYVAMRIEYYAGEFPRVLARGYLSKQSGDDSSGLRAVMGLASGLHGRLAKAEADLNAAATLYPDSVLIRGVLGYIYALSGRLDEARQMLTRLIRDQAQMRASAPYAIALVYCGLNEREEAFHWIERGTTEWSMWLAALDADTAFAALREDRRFPRR